jgi:hypothetical protein
LFIEEYNKVANGLVERLTAAIAEEKYCLAEMERDMPHGHQYDQDKTTLYIKPETEPEEVKSESSSDTEDISDGQSSDLRTCAIVMFIVVFSCLLFGWVECLMMTCIAPSQDTR